MAATEEHWDLTGPLPVPKGDWLRCPVCRGDQVQLRVWKFHRIGKSKHRTPTHDYRCDVPFKCVACAATWTHGVAVPAEMYENAPTERQIEWRDGLRMLKGKGGL